MDVIPALLIGIGMGMIFSLLLFMSGRSSHDSPGRVECDGIIYITTIDTAATDSLNNWRNK